MTCRVILLFCLLAPPAFAAAPPVVRLDAYGDPLPAGAVSRLGSSRLRHLFTMNNAVAISPDGRLLASLARDLRIWDRATGRLVAWFHPPLAYCWSVEFAPDGRHLVTGHGGDGDEVLIWDLPTGKSRPLWGDGEYRGVPEHFAFSRDGKVLAVLAEVTRGDEPTRAFLFDFPSGKARGSVPLPFRFIKEGMALDPVGNVVVPSEGVHVMDSKTGRELARKGGKIGIYSFALSPDGKTAAVQTREKDREKDEEAHVRLIRLDTGATVKSDVAGPYRSRMAFSAGGKELYFSSRQGDVVAINPLTGKQTRVIVPSDGVWRPWAAFSADGRWLVRSDGQSLRVNDLRTGKEPVAFDDHRDGSGSSPVASGGQGIGAAVSPDGRRVATCSGSEMRLWDWRSGRMLRRIPGKKFGFHVRWTPDGKQLAVGQKDTFAWYDAETGKKVREVPLPAIERWEPNPWLLPDGKRIAVREGPSFGRASHTLLRASDGKKLARYGRPKDEEVLDLSKDGNSVLLADRPDGGGIVLRVQKEGRQRVFAQPFSDTDLEARLLLGGRMVAIAGTGGRLEAWDVARGRPVGPATALLVKLYRPRILTASPDGRLLVVAESNVPPPTWRQGWGQHPSNRSRLHLLETATGKTRASTAILPSVSGATFFPDGKHLLTTSADGTALVWRPDELAPGLDGSPWEALAGADAGQAFAAVVALSASPGEAMALLRKQLQPARVDAKLVRAWLADLDAEEFEKRAKAEEHLGARGADVEGDLVAALRAGSGEEVLQRLRRLLARAEGGTPECWRHGRAVEVLERIGTPAARGLLRDLAAGHPGARRTREAREALGRLEGK